MKKRVAVALAFLSLLATPGTATADVIFDPADADELAASLAEAYADQKVCYGWDVTVNDVATTDHSVGSNFGAGKSVGDGDCDKSVEFRATITYTSEASESEDSASFDVSSNPPAISRGDLTALGIDMDGLTGEDPDVPIGQAVLALPLLAADKGLARPISATPDTATPAADAQLTDDPGSDWWRGQGGTLLWGIGFLLAGGLFVWWILYTNRRSGHSIRRTAPVSVPDSVPSEWTQPPPRRAPRRTPTRPSSPVEEPESAEQRSTVEGESTAESPSTVGSDSAVESSPTAELESTTESSSTVEPPSTAESPSTVEPPSTADAESTVEPESAEEPEPPSAQESASQEAPASDTSPEKPPTSPDESTKDSGPAEQQERPAPSDRQDKE